GVVGEYYTPGIVVINGNAERLIHRLGTALPANSELILLNEQGGWLAGGGDQNWQFSITPSATFASSHPGLWEGIKSSQTGQFELAGECYNYTWHSYRDGEVSSPRWLIGQRRVGAPCTTELVDNVQQGAMRSVIAFGLSFPLLLLWHRASARKRELVSNLEARNEELRLIANESGHGLLRVDAQGCVEWMNREAERLLGWKEADLEGQNLHETCHQFEDGESLHKGPCPNLEALQTGQTYRSEHERMLDRNGNIVHLTMSVSAYGEDGERRAIVAISDISTHIQKEENLVTVATTDSLTGALNRRSLLQQLDVWTTNAANPPCLLMLDIDHFKRVNDTYGHQCGDDAIKHVVDIIGRGLDELGCLGRCGHGG
ncbi:diguanylate cyclase, partial [uncultured Sulfitobacter sp.]|uniref:sensor domain-containing diguanylate cyclase n=1 Tax=uncultured Sulfitobacter sp. TaxID=191468 RepID=UPI002591C875